MSSDMIDHVYLTYGANGVTGMRKTKPPDGAYVHLRIAIPKPPTVEVNLPQATPEVTGDLAVLPRQVDDVIWCEAHGATHEPAPDVYGDLTEGCEESNWQPVYHKQGYTP